MSAFALLFAALLPTASAADPSQPISIRPGEAVTLEFRDRKAIVLERKVAPPIGDYERTVSADLEGRETTGSGIQPAVPYSREDIKAPPPVAKPGQILLTFRIVQATRPGSDQHSLLVVLNGYDQSFHYRVLTHRQGKISATDVCEVPPKVPMSEHWPYSIEQIDLVGAWLEPWETGQVRCE